MSGGMVEMEIKVLDLDGVRIDKYLTSSTDMSRNKIKKLIDNEKINVNGKIVKASYIVKIDDLITIDDSLIDEDIDIVAENIPLDIVYEDEYLLVVNKKSGMVVHPGNGNYHNTLVNALMYHCNTNLSTINGSVRPGIVHRIDADTSGLLLVAKNDLVRNDLAKQISEKSVLRKYVALVSGVIKEDSATIDAPIGRDSVDRKKMTVTSDNSKDAVTHIKVLKRYENTTLIECKLETGRTHQIRVHMAYIKHPVVNDPVYGYQKTDETVLKNHTKNEVEFTKYREFGQLLHAKELGFIHPITKELLDFQTEVPAMFNEILQMYQD